MINKFLLTLVLIAFATSCKKNEPLNHKVSCPNVAVENVPDTILNSFKTQFSNGTVKKWFNKDNSSYVALFEENGCRKLCQFSNEGVFMGEKTEMEHIKHKDHPKKFHLFPHKHPKRPIHDEEDKGCHCEDN